mgnify:CR=1 FL=1
MGPGGDVNRGNNEALEKVDAKQLRLDRCVLHQSRSLLIKANSVVEGMSFLLVLLALQGESSARGLVWLQSYS